MILQSELLNKFPELIHGFSMVDENEEGRANMSLKKGAADQVLASRARFCKALGLDPDSIVMADQVHSADVLLIDSTDRGKGANTLFSPLGKADALCTQERNLPLTVIVADCAAVYCYDPVHSTIGLAHSGWRGTAKQIVPRMISKMRKHFHSLPEDLYVWISPCIGPESFEVGSEVLEIFQKEFSKLNLDRQWYQSSPDNPSRWLLDLKSLLLDQLLGEGVFQDHIEVSPECTFTSEKFFSYRREGQKAGHMMAFLALSKEKSE